MDAKEAAENFAIYVYRFNKQFKAKGGGTHGN